MRLITFIVAGAAIGYGINYMSKKGENGASLLDDIAEKAPDWFDQAKKFVVGTVEQVRQHV